jgi:hypothetical protein
MAKMKIYSGTDCSEIAEDLFSAAGGEGRILRIEPLNKGYLTLLEGGVLQTEFIYHEVYTDGKYIFDPRLHPQPVFLEEWQILIKHLNPGVEIP